MGFQVSPGVDVKEIDLTNVIPAVSTSIGAIAGLFSYGPIDEVVEVGSEKDLVALFGKPTEKSYPYFYNAANFLKYGNALRVVRPMIADDTIKNATTGSAGTLVKNKSEYINKHDAASPSDFVDDGLDGKFIAKYAGSLGNSLKVHVLSHGNFAVNGQSSTATDPFDGAPTNSTDSTEEFFHIVVEDEDGEFSGTPGTVLETFTNVSTKSTAKAETGGSNFYSDVLRDKSAYIYAGHIYLASELAALTAVTADSLDNGSDYSNNQAEETEGPHIAAAIGDFFGATDQDINFIIGGGIASTDATTVIQHAETRKDAIAFVSPPVSSVTIGLTAADRAAAVSAATSWANTITSSSYGVLDSTSVYIYDKYNDKNRWVSASGLIAGLCAYTDDVADAWFSPAGYNRGQLRGIIKLGYNPTQAQRDTLYKARINPLVSFPGNGTVLFGDKTALSKPSAFDRINVRRLFITIQKAISTAAKYQLFEFNDEFTRAMFRNMTEPFLREVKGRRGITDFAVVCDETNNTPNVIDTNQFVADIYVKPARSINFITLNFIATRTGVEFSEIIGQ